MRAKPPTDRDLDTLGELAAANRNHLEHDYREGWARPMDCGGSDGSHHSQTLQKLTRKGLVEVRDPSTKWPWRSRLGGGACYRITAAGRQALIDRALAELGETPISQLDRQPLVRAINAIRLAKGERPLTRDVFSNMNELRGEFLRLAAR